MLSKRPQLQECYNRAMRDGSQFDEITYEPVGEPELDPATGIVLESLRRRQPMRTIS